MAYWLTYTKKKKVLVIDADAQRSSSVWLASLESGIPFEVLQTPDDLLEQIPLLAERYEYLVVDAPAGLAEACRAILFRADLAIVPCQPTGIDLKSASDAVRIIRQAQSVRGGAPAAAIFLSRAVRGTRLLDEAIALLTKTNIPVLKTVIHQKQVIADTFGQSKVVWNLLGKSATESANEFDRLFKEIMRMLK